MFKLIGKKILTILPLNISFILTYQKLNMFTMYSPPRAFKGAVLVFKFDFLALMLISRRIPDDENLTKV